MLSAMSAIRQFRPGFLFVWTVIFIVAGACSARPVNAASRILWVDSYHAGYEWSDAIEHGIRSVLKKTDTEFAIHRMNTKNCPTEACGQSAAARALGVVEAWRPDVLIASDDNAQKYLVVPHLRDTALPIVFCGVNWDASEYGYPTKHITGMIEVELVKETVAHLRRFARGDRIGYLSGDTASARKNIAWLNRHYFDNQMIAYRVTQFEEFKRRFLQIQGEVDMMILHNNAAIAGWDALAAKRFIAENLRIPIASPNEWMAPFVIFTLGKIPEEQGRYAAETALNILAGVQPADIPVATNQQANLTVNLEMANALGIVLPLSVLKVATVTGRNPYELPASAGKMSQQDLSGKRICWVDSYHQGYEWSDGIERAIREVLYGTGIDLKIIRMNTKRDNTLPLLRQAAERARRQIIDYKPDLVIASDDNAQKYLIVPHFKDTDLPVVFCGVNMDASEYGYPAVNVTGMIEINPINELVDLLKRYARGERIGFLAGNTATERKLVNIYKRRFFGDNMIPYLIDSWADFEKTFIAAQAAVDILIFANYTGIAGWDAKAAGHIIRQHTRIPTGSDNSFMEQWVVCTLEKFPEEQGQHAAFTALRILGGQSPASIPLVTNQANRLTVNLDLAQKAGIVFPLSVLKQARVIGQTGLD